MFDTILRLERSELGNVEESPAEEKDPAFIKEFESEHVIDVAG
jgi:hypothetical protein